MMKVKKSKKIKSQIEKKLKKIMKKKVNHQMKIMNLIPIILN